MNLTRHGITLSIADDEVIRLALERFNATPPAIAPTRTWGDPAIGEVWTAYGGVYAGIARGRDGASDYYLIAGPEFEGQLAWKDAMDWAVKQTHEGFSDFTLPYRREQSLLFANVPELFKPEAYWSRESPESDSDFAWGQSFVSGGQYYWGKSSKLRARAVRRVPI